MKYRVEHLKNNTYQVLEPIAQGFEAYTRPVFKGSISDCEAYIRLKQNENVEF